MKVALVTSFPAFPASAGNRSRIRQLARAVQQLGHELTFVLLPAGDEFVDDAAHVAAFGKAGYVRLAAGLQGDGSEERNWPGKWTLRQIRTGLRLAARRMHQHRWGGWTLRQFVRGAYAFRRVAGLEAAYYAPLDRSRTPESAEQLAAIGRGVDAVIVEYVFNSWAFDCFPRSALRLLDTHDAFADRHRSYLARGVADYWVSLRRGDENAGFRRADVLLAIQPEEARGFASQLSSEPGQPAPEIAVISHVVDPGDAPVACGTGNAAVFVASDNSANRHAVNSFLQNVLPRVVRDLPDFDLRLAGAICAHVPDRPNVTKLGWVEDVRAAFASAPLAVNPVLVGTGINIKLLEAMAAGVPTVSTATGVRGLPQAYRRGILAVPDADHAGFALGIVRLLQDADRRRQAGRLAFEDARCWNAEQVTELGRILGRSGHARPSRR